MTGSSDSSLSHDGAARNRRATRSAFVFEWKNNSRLDILIRHHLPDERALVLTICRS